MKNCTTHSHACDCREEYFRNLEEANKVLREAVGGLIHHCRDYALTEESFVIAMEVDKAIDALAKADEAIK